MTKRLTEGFIRSRSWGHRVEQPVGVSDQGSWRGSGGGGGKYAVRKEKENWWKGTVVRKG